MVCQAGESTHKSFDYELEHTASSESDMFLHQPPPLLTANSDPDIHKCTLRVEVLNETSSGEHKFKVIQLVVKSWLDTSLLTSKPGNYNLRITL